MSKYEFQWRSCAPPVARRGADAEEAHLCVINRDNPDSPKASAVCGFGYPGMPKYRAATPAATGCPKCLAIERGGRRITFKDPQTGRETVIREGK